MSPEFYRQDFKIKLWNQGPEIQSSLQSSSSSSSSMEEETVGEVLFETCYHAIQPLSPDFSQDQLHEGSKGGFFSLLSTRGLNQLKEKWNEKKHPRTLQKRSSLFISHRGEYIAVATQNRITILQRGDNYTHPCGIFTSNDRRTIFTHGAWSDSHGVLGVIDDMNTLYFVKSDGEEIARITKRQLKTAAQIIGLIIREDMDAKSSCLCGFNILMSDGLLHQIEVSHDPSASIFYKPTHKELLQQFPQSVSCIDFHPELSFLVVVGVVDVLENSRGLYCLSLWSITRSSDLELLFCSPHFQGSFSTQKGLIPLFTTPKVVFSPQGKYIAALDLSGNLDIFYVDREQCSLSIFTFGENCDSQKANKLFPGRKKFLNEIVDFTWWSDHVLILAKRNGVVTMLDIISGVKCLRNDLIFSMPILERVQQCQGCVFILESVTSEGLRLPISSVQGDTIDVQEQIAKEKLDVNGLHWRLMSFSKRSASEMYTILIRNQEYQVALDFANRHGLDRDEVFKSQWLQSTQGTNEINMLLSNIEDKKFVLSECVHKVGSTEDAVRALLSYGLHITDEYRFSDSEDDSFSFIWHFRMVRLQLLQCRDRLETFLGINMGRFSVPDYCKFRAVPINEASLTIAESGKIGALNLLFKRHPYSLAPFILNILSAIPETVPVQTYCQLLPGRSPPSTVSLRDRDWVECEKMIDFIERVAKNNESSIQVRTELILKQCKGFVWPSVAELSLWYKKRARDIDSLSGQLHNCLSMVDFACKKGISDLQRFHEDISYLYQLVYPDVCDDEINFTMSLVSWEQLADYEKFKIMLKGVKEETVVERLQERAIPFLRDRSCNVASASEDCGKTDSFLVRWLKEIAIENKLDICLIIIEEACRDLQGNWIFKDEFEAVEVTLQCIYLCSLTDRWNSMASILSKVSQITSKGNIGGYLEPTNAEIYVENLEKRLKIAEGHVEAGRLLAYYQVPKPMSFFLGAHSDEKGIKQLLRLVLSKFGRRQPGRSDNDWANMWRDIQCLQEKAFPFLDTEYMLMEFCRGLLKAGRFSLARNYLKGTGAITLATEKAENLVIQAAREYFFSASSLSCSEIWKAKECLNLFPNSKIIKAESDVIDALTVKLPNLGVTLLPMQYRQIRNPMEIINMVVTSQSGAYLDVDELIEIAKLLGLSSQEDIAAVQETVAREAAVAGDLQQAFDLCVILAKKGHGPIWDLCAAIARGPALDNMDTSSRKQLLGFALSHCDEESIGELLHAWKDLDTQFQCENLMTLTGTNPPDLSVQGFSLISMPAHNVQDIVGVRNCSEMMGVSTGQESNDAEEVYMRNIKRILSMVGKDIGIENGTSWDSLLRENRKVLSFAALQLPWLLEVIGKEDYGKRIVPGGKKYMSVRVQAVHSILSWLARNGIAPRDDLIASLAKSVMEPPVTEEEDILGCSFLLNLSDAFHGVQIIEEQLNTREGYQEISSINDIGMAYSSLHNSVLECSSPDQRRELLLHKFHQRYTSPKSDAMDKIDKVQSTFWREWKFRLEEQKRYADQTRTLEQVIPGVETARFLSGDFDYIQSAVFSFINSVKREKKPILKEAVRLADTYGLNRTEVLLWFLASTLVSELWANDDIIIEISNYKEEMLTCAVPITHMISSVVYPAIEGFNKLRLAYIYSILSDCYSHVKEFEEPMSMIHNDPLHTRTLGLSQFYKVLEQECRRVAFIKDLNFKNIAGLSDLNFEHFNNEVYSHICESNVEALAKMVETLVGIYDDSADNGLMSWQDVYKHHVLSLLNSLETGTKLKLHPVNPDDLTTFIGELEKNYDSCRIYIRSMSELYLLEIMRKYYALSLPHCCSGCRQLVEEKWMDCLLLLLDFWVLLADDIQDIVCLENYEEKHVMHNSERLSKCLKVFRRLVMEDKVPMSLGWATISEYVNHGLVDDFTANSSSFCKAMVFSGCGFDAVAEIFSEVILGSLTSLSLGTDITGEPDATQSLNHFYVNMLDLVLMELGSGSGDRRNLHCLLSSLSKLEGNLEHLRRVRYAVWRRLSEFSDNMQLKSHIRVYALELMQLVSGRNPGGFPSELSSEVPMWEGWDESHGISRSDASDQGAAKQFDEPSKLTNTIVALKSTQLVSVISPSIEITQEDLMTIDLAVSCFLRLSEAASSALHLNVLEAVLEQWEGLFTGGKDDEESDEVPDAGNNWSNDGWDDEGWESFQDEPIENRGKKVESVTVHPLHVCWMEIIKKLIESSQLADVMKLIDRSLSRPIGIILAEEEAQSLSELLVGIDCFMALKIVLLVPYEAVWFHCLGAVEANLKNKGIPDTKHGDYELLTTVLSSDVIPTIINDSNYNASFSCFCHMVGCLSRLCQEGQLSAFRHRGMDANETDRGSFVLFSKILFPCFVSELVKAGNFLLAGFLVSKFMHTNTTLSLINVAEASLRRYLEGQIRAQQNFGPELDKISASSSLLNTISRLRDKSVGLFQSALSTLPTNVK